jgi:hypothetical protein
VRDLTRRQQPARHEALECKDSTPAGMPVVAWPARRVPVDLGGAGQLKRAPGVEVEEEQ